MEIAIVLGLPLAGALLLALAGHKDWAPELNATMSFATFFAAILLTTRVVAEGPMVWLPESLEVDPSGVLLAMLAGFFKGAFFVVPFHGFPGSLTAFVR